MKRQKAEVVYLLLVEHLLLQLLHHLALVVDLVILRRQTRQPVSGIAVLQRTRCPSKSHLFFFVFLGFCQLEAQTEAK